MKIPKVFGKNGHEYIFVEKCNDNLFLYKDMLSRIRINKETGNYEICKQTQY